jgi:peptidoglycan-N-acetylglucosamine deacetylase
MNAPPPPAVAGAGAALAAADGAYVGGAEAGVAGAPCAGAEDDGVEGGPGVAARAPHLVQKVWPSLSGDPQLVQNAAMLISPLDLVCLPRKTCFVPSIVTESSAIGNLFGRPCENMRVNPWFVAAPALAAAGAGLTAYAARYPHAQILGAVISRTNSSRKLAITFDDGPNPAMTPKFLELLARYNARATFFLIGRYVRECPELVRELVARGHEVGNHTQTHPNLFRTGPGRTRDELRQCQGAIANAVETAPRFFRPPWGFRSPWLAGAAKELNLRTVMWSLLPGDWRAPTDQWLIDRAAPIADRSQNRPGPATPCATGDVLCVHDGSHNRQNADRSHTLAALEYWLPRWRDLGLEFVTIEEAVRAPAL